MRKAVTTDVERSGGEVMHGSTASSSTGPSGEQHKDIIHDSIAIAVKADRLDKEDAKVVKKLRHDMPVQRMRGRGDRAKALEVAGNPELLRQARDDLREGMIAATTRVNKNSKLGFAIKLAATAGHGEIFPLTFKVIEDVAAALRAAEYSSGFAYLAELRGKHEDLGHDVPRGWCACFRGAKPL